MHEVISVPAGIATPPISSGRPPCDCRAGWSFRSAGTPRSPGAISAGSAISRARSSGWLGSATSALPIRLVVVSWPALRMKMQFWSSS